MPQVACGASHQITRMRSRKSCSKVSPRAAAFMVDTLRVVYAGDAIVVRAALCLNWYLGRRAGVSRAQTDRAASLGQMYQVQGVWNPTYCKAGLAMRAAMPLCSTELFG